MMHTAAASGLQVEVKRAQRDFQTAEVLGLSLREQLTAREGELRELGSRHSALQAEQASWCMVGQGKQDARQYATPCIAWSRPLNARSARHS